MKIVTLIVIIVVAALLVHRCSTLAATLRFRITVDVDTPGGTRTGSSVMEWVQHRKWLIGLPGVGGTDYGGGSTVYGEMPIIDLDGHQVLFSLMHDSLFRGERNISEIVLNGTGFYKLRGASDDPSGASIFRELNATDQAGSSMETSGRRWRCSATHGTRLR